MRIKRIYLHAVLTAVLFPVVLVGMLWALDGLSDESWHRSDYVISRAQALAIAEKDCFAQDRGGYTKGRRHSYLKGDVWIIGISKESRFVVLPGLEQKVAVAELNAHNGFLTHCTFLGWETGPGRQW